MTSLLHPDPVQALGALHSLLDGSSPTGGTLQLHGIPQEHLEGIVGWAVSAGIPVTDRGRGCWPGFPRVEFEVRGVFVSLWAESDLEAAA